jgi:dynactin complex subunit
VAHDELWNLNPTTRNINSAKNNHLPKWDSYFNSLMEIEYVAYEMVWRYDKVHNAFEKCLTNNVNSNDVKRQLYRPNIEKREFGNNLCEIMLPVYQAAEKMGFRDWVYTNES